MQENDDNENDEQDRLRQRVQHRLDRGADELGGVVVDLVIDARRKAQLELFEPFVNGVGGCNGIAARKLEHAE